MDDERRRKKISKIIVKKENQFASGIRVLLVDSDQESLKYHKTMLKERHYKVMAVDKAEKALDLLNQREVGFDMLLVDTSLPLMNGFDLLEIVQKDFKIPVLMMSSDNRVNVSVRALKLGALIVFSKPINQQSIEYLWQHVHNKHVEQCQLPKASKRSSLEGNQYSMPSKNEVQGQAGSSKVKDRIVWTAELHNKFLEAIYIIGNGIQNVFPEKIVELMNIRGLTRKHVASHLQKFRLSLKGNVIRRNRWNSPNGVLGRNYGVSYDPSASRHKRQTALAPNVLPRQGPTVLLPEPEMKSGSSDLYPSGIMPPFGSQFHSSQGQSTNIFMNQGTWQNSIVSNVGNTPQPWGLDALTVNQQNFGCSSSYMMPVVADQEGVEPRVAQEVFPIEETFQNTSIQDQEPIPDSDNMHAFGTETEGLAFNQADNNDESWSNKLSGWENELRGLILSEGNQVNASGDVNVNLDGDINEAGMLNNTDSNNTTMELYSSGQGQSPMLLAEQTENDGSWLNIPAAHEPRWDDFMDASISNMQQGDDSMNAADLDLVESWFREDNWEEI